MAAVAAAPAEAVAAPLARPDLEVRSPHSEPTLPGAPVVVDKPTPLAPPPMPDAAPKKGPAPPRPLAPRPAGALKPLPPSAPRMPLPPVKAPTPPRPPSDSSRTSESVIHVGEHDVDLDWDT